MFAAVCEASNFKILSSGFQPGVILNAVHFNSSSSGIVSGNTTVKKTSNGGLNWVTTSSSPPGSTINDLFSTSSTAFWAATDLGLFQSINGGSSWVSRIPSTSVNQLNWISPTIAYCASSAGIYRSTNFGTNWSRVTSVSAERISMWTPSIGFSSSTDTVFYTTRAWNSYSTCWPNLMNNIRSVLARGTASAVIAGYDYWFDFDYEIGYYIAVIGRTNDAGISWISTYRSGARENQKFTFEDMCSAGNQIFSVGRFVDYFDNEEWVLASNDDGLSWTQFHTPRSYGLIIRSVSFPDASSGWLCGEGPSLFGPDQKPFVGIDKPVTNQTVGCSVSVDGTVSDTELNYWKLEVGSGSNPITYDSISTGFNLKFKSGVGVWNSQLYPEGFYTLRLSAFNNGGASASYSTVVFLDGTPPQITITAPVDGGEVWGEEVQIIAEVLDAGLGVKHVGFYFDGGWRCTDSYAPYTYCLNSKPFSNGAHSIKVLAEDNGGRTSEKTINVQINNGLFTNVNPQTVSFANGFPGQSLQNDACVVAVKNHTSSTASLMMKTLTAAFCAGYSNKKYYIDAGAGTFSTLPTSGAAIVAGQRSFTTAYATIAYNIPPGSYVNLLQRFTITYPASCFAGNYTMSASYEAYPEPTIRTTGQYLTDCVIRIKGSASVPGFKNYRIEAISDAKVKTIVLDSSIGQDAYYNTLTQVIFGNQTYVQSTDDNYFGFQEYGFFKFPLTSLPNNVEIFSSTLVLQEIYNSFVPQCYWGSIEVPWSESVISKFSSSDSQYRGNMSDKVRADITELTCLWYSGTKTNNGVWVAADALGGDGQIRWGSRENMSTEYRPRLRVSYSDGNSEIHSICSSSSEVVDNELGIWNTLGLGAGVYTLRLIINKQDGSSLISEKTLVLKDFL